jgi:hypothetical protein
VAQGAYIVHNPRIIACEIDLQSGYDMSVEVLANAVREAEQRDAHSPHAPAVVRILPQIRDDTRAIVRVEQEPGFIHVIRGARVMLDVPLAALFGVPKWRINDAVKRNPNWFPSDFAFQLTQQENEAFSTQCANSKGRGGRRALPYAFTQLGVAMLSSVLRSKRAMGVNIEIMRTFVGVRQILANDSSVAHRADTVECHASKRGEPVQAILDAILKLTPPEPNQQLIKYNASRIQHPIVQVMGLCLAESKKDD